MKRLSRRRWTKKQQMQRLQPSKGWKRRGRRKKRLSRIQNGAGGMRTGATAATRGLALRDQVPSAGVLASRDAGLACDNTSINLEPSIDGAEKSIDLKSSRQACKAGQAHC